MSRDTDLANFCPEYPHLRSVNTIRHWKRQEQTSSRYTISQMSQIGGTWNNTRRPGVQGGIFEPDSKRVSLLNSQEWNSARQILRRTCNDRKLIAQWCYENGLKEKTGAEKDVIEKIVKDGKTYFIINGLPCPPQISTESCSKRFRESNPKETTRQARTL